MITSAEATRRRSAGRQSKLRDLLASFRPFWPTPGLAADTLRVTVERAPGAQAGYAIGCAPQPAAAGMLHQADLIGYPALHSLRRDYARRLHVLRGLGAVGLGRAEGGPTAASSRASSVSRARTAMPSIAAPW